MRRRGSFAYRITVLYCTPKFSFRLPEENDDAYDPIACIWQISGNNCTNGVRGCLISFSVSVISSSYLYIINIPLYETDRGRTSRNV